MYAGYTHFPAGHPNGGFVMAFHPLWLVRVFDGVTVSPLNEEMSVILSLMDAGVVFWKEDDSCEQLEHWLHVVQDDCVFFVNFSMKDSFAGSAKATVDASRSTTRMPAIRVRGNLVMNITGPITPKEFKFFSHISQMSRKNLRMKSEGRICYGRMGTFCSMKDTANDRITKYAMTVTGTIENKSYQKTMQGG